MADVTFRDKKGRIIDTKKKLEKLKTFNFFLFINMLSQTSKRINLQITISSKHANKEIHDDFLVANLKSKLNDNNECEFDLVIEIKHMND